MTKSAFGPYAWLRGDALDVAPQLIGCELYHHTAAGDVGGRIVEVEAYHGPADAASHAWRGPTPRTAPMFDVGGVIYVYRSYGIHLCVNIVTGPLSDGQAVLIRALEPLRGLDIMRTRRGNASDRLLTSGPGRVGQALGLTLAMSGRSLGRELILERPSEPLSPQLIAHGPRIGIAKAVDQPWRFWLAGSPYVSR